jgi:hypothetical protein
VFVWFFMCFCDSLVLLLFKSLIGAHVVLAKNLPKGEIVDVVDWQQFLIKQVLVLSCQDCCHDMFSSVMQE